MPLKHRMKLTGNGTTPISEGSLVRVITLVITCVNKKLIVQLLRGMCLNVCVK